ncbi:MAG: tetraacyldisaccharide 4'-kinase [Planctomycetota bacterium]
MDEADWLAVMGGERRGVKAGVLRAGLSVLEPGYRLGNAVRSALFGCGLKRVKALGRPTVSIGNVTTGGTGKTPMVLWVCRVLMGMGVKPCVLTRGYRGGDEARELASALGGAVGGVGYGGASRSQATGLNETVAWVWPDADRVRGARAALAADEGIGVFVLDDGFQHRRAGRDLDWVLVDATRPWGFGRLLPRGLLREPRGALRRADGVIVTRADRVPPEELEALCGEVEGLTGRVPVAVGVHAWEGWRVVEAGVFREWQAVEDGGPGVPPPGFSDIDRALGGRVFGVCGIGNAGAFEGMLREAVAEAGGEVVHVEAKPDHHGYSWPELRALLGMAESAGAGGGAIAVVTTEKDWVKWAELLEGEELRVPVLRPVLSMRFTDGEAALERGLASLVG